MIEPGEDPDPLIIELYNKGLTYPSISAELARRGCYHCTVQYVKHRTKVLRRAGEIKQRPMKGRPI